MNRVRAAFADELTKLGALGPLKPLWAFAKKKPMTTIGLTAIPAVGGYGAYKAYKSGRSGQKGRYLQAEPGRPSKVALINYNRLMGKRPINEDISKSYREEAFV